MSNLPPFNSTEEFLKLFNIGNGTPYSLPTILNDRKVGFSTQRNYPKDIPYIPPKTNNGKDDTVALIHVLYMHPSELKVEFDPHKVPIMAMITTHSLYRLNHFDYDFSEPDCPTEESLQASKSTPQPIALDFFSDFFYDHEKEKFFDRTNNYFTGDQLLNRIFDEHCDTVRFWEGMKYRFQVKGRTLSISILTIPINLIPLVLKKGFGRTLDESKNITSLLQGYKRTDLKKLSIETLDIFKYKTSKNVIILFCALVFLGFIVWSFSAVKISYFSSIFSHPFLAITHTILILAFLDLVFPNILFGILNFLIKWRAKLLVKGLPRF